MKCVKYVLCVVALAIFGWSFTNSPLSMDMPFIVLLAIGAVGFFVYGLNVKKQINKKLPKVGLLYIFIFLAINIGINRHILLFANSFSAEFVSELSLKKAIIFSALKFSGYLVLEVFLFIVVRGIARIVQTNGSLALDSINIEGNDNDVDNELRAEEMDFWNAMQGLAIFISGVSKVSFFIVLVSIVGGILISFYNKTFVPELLEKIVNLSVLAGMSFSLILIIAILGIYGFRGSQNHKNTREQSQ